jgi:positive regulator of sigma E activity
MNLSFLVYLVVLFFLLVPGILVTLPKGGNKWTVAITHALVFAVVYVLIENLYNTFSKNHEGFKEGIFSTLLKMGNIQKNKK